MNNQLISQIMSQISEQEVINIIKDLVEIPSYSGIQNQETQVAKYINNLFEKENIESKIVPITDGRCNVIAKLKGASNGKTLLLTGHLDTVPPYDMEKPFNTEIKDGMLYGRGTVDMKGSLACMISAMIGIKRAKIKLSGDVIFAGVIDEEQKSLGTINLIESGIKADAAIVGEPTNLDICLAHRGLEWLEFHIIGKTVHGGNQANGINAIQKTTNLIKKIEEKLIPKLKSKHHPLIGSPSMNYGTIKGGTQPSTVAGDCYLTIDRRWLPNENYQEVIEDYKNIIKELKKEDKEFNCTFKVMDESFINEKYIHEAMEIDPKHPIINIVYNLTKEIYKKTPEKTYFKAWSDGGLISKYTKIPTIIFAPGDLETAHTSKECIEISQVYPATLIYALTAIEFCN